MDVLHQPEVLGVGDRDINQHGQRLLQGFPQNGTQLVGSGDPIALATQCFGETDNVVFTQLHTGWAPVGGLLLTGNYDASSAAVALTSVASSAFGRKAWSCWMGSTSIATPGSWLPVFQRLAQEREWRELITALPIRPEDPSPDRRSGGRSPA